MKQEARIPDAPAWDRAAYPAAEAARLVGMTPTRVRRWLRGYDYRYSDGRRHKEAVLSRKGTAGTTYASFLDLVDLLFVKRFVDHGISLQKLRRALREATDILGEPHFARRTFFTDGHNIYLKVREEADAILQLLSGGQWVIAPIIQELGQQIDFDTPSGIARRWYPRGATGLIVVDPLIAFGRPAVAGKGVPTAAVYDFYKAEHADQGAVGRWHGLTNLETEAAVTFEEALQR
jgi:uncharacterized protein (DUF433 family)